MIDYLYILYYQKPTMYINKLCIFFFLFTIYCKDLLYVAQLHPTSFYNCFRQTGYDQVRLLLDTDFEDQSIVNILNAKNAGLKVHAAYLLCRNKSFNQLGQQFMKFFGPLALENIWLAAYTDSDDPQCSWVNHSGQQNCQYLKQLMEGLKKYNINAGTIMYKQYWTQLFGSVSACPELSNFLSWWIPGEGEQDLQPNFNSYKQQIGGWTKPFMKLYFSRLICGIKDVLMNYYE